jgi:hypothetical protein
MVLMERGELAYEGGGTAIVEELRDRPNARLRNRVHRLLRGRNTFRLRFQDPDVQARAYELVAQGKSEPARNALATV